MFNVRSASYRWPDGPWLMYGPSTNLTAAIAAICIWSQPYCEHLALPYLRVVVDPGPSRFGGLVYPGDPYTIHLTAAVAANQNLAEGTIVHEITHVMQMESGTVGRTCIDNETPAFDAQWRYWAFRDPRLEFMNPRDGWVSSEARLDCEALARPDAWSAVP